MASYESFTEKLDSSWKKTEYSVGPGKFTVSVQETEEAFKISIISNISHLTLHWGLGISKPKDWKCPLDCTGYSIPAHSVKFDEKAAQSPFVEIHDSLSVLEIVFEKDSAPKQLNFVLKRENTWFNNSNRNYEVPLKVPESVAISGAEETKNMVNNIIEAETTYGSWTLMHRFKLCNDWLNRLGNDLDSLSWIYVWMRYSALRKLDWQRRFNTRPSELASSQQNLTFTITNLLKSASTEGLVNPYILLRGILTTMGKGGNNGQRIRDEILQIMHRNGIKEHDNYYEQWHQKLHNNTTPDDIGICEATIAFNETNNMGRFWEVLSKHGISRERLKSFERPITMEPFYAPQLIGDLYNYLSLLKAVHGSSDLTQSINCCRGFLPGDLVNKLNDLLSNLKHWDKIAQMEKTLTIRTDLHRTWNKNDIGQYREALYLDIGLEEYTRQLCEEIIHLDIKIKHLCRELKILLQNVLITANNQELRVATSDFIKFYERFGDTFERDIEDALIMKSACDRLTRVLGTYVDVYSKLIDSKARKLGSEFGVEAHFVDIFAEESIRGSILFAVSIVLKKINGILRQLCNFKSWQVISPKSQSSGRLLKVQSLHSVAYTVYTEPTVLICEKVTGEEEIPDNVTAVISCTELDALAHVCVRARNNKVLLAICYGSEEIEALQKFIGAWVVVAMTSAGISVNQGNRTNEENKVSEAREVKKPLPLEKIVISAEEFGEGKTGAKGNNCAALRKALPAEIGVPSNVALPYGTCEYMLGLPINSEISARIDSLLQELEGKEHDSQAKNVLDLIKSEVMKLSVSPSDQQTIQQMLDSIGCTSAKWPLAWKAIKAVWASKFNERAYLSMIKSRIPISAVVMSVLCQEVITGDYAYVLHTKNPFTNNSQEVYGELVLGLGETLVGAFEGRAFSFVVNKSTGNYQINSFPNKSVALEGSGFIFRSDSNSEDLPGFAGAGLFDSFVMEEPREKTLEYGEERIVNSRDFRIGIIHKLNQVGKLVEDFYQGVPQDIEGVIAKGKIFVVQARPQV